MDSKREMRSFLVGRDPSVDRRCRPRPERQVRLFGERVVEENVDSSSSSSCDDLCSETTGLDPVQPNTALIYLRLRPVGEFSAAYSISEAGNVLIAKPQGDSTSNNKNMMEKHYSFSNIFDSKVEQRDVYEMCVRQRVESEESFTVLTYGTSGSGKTFTLLGDVDKPGIVPRSLEHIFTMYGSNIYPHPSLKLVNGGARIQDDAALAKDLHCGRRLLDACTDLQSQHTQMQEIVRANHEFQALSLPDVSVFIWVSFVEIYNECVLDLLTPVSSACTAGAAAVIPTAIKNLKIVGNDGKVFIKGLTSVYVKSSLEAFKLLRYGLRRVNYASTSINARSSRSHCIFLVDILKYSSNNVVSEISYKFCDLAGSERLEKTGNVGHRLKEAQSINTSLMVLGRCMDAANANAARNKKGNDVVPYRESKLTMLLQTALLGKETLGMIVNVTPIEEFYEENLTVLNFSSIAKNIVFCQPPIKQKKLRYSFLMNNSKAIMCAGNTSSQDHTAQLLEENIFLRNELDRLNVQRLADIEKLQYEHKVELLQQEQALRNKLVDSYQTMMEEDKRQADRRLAHVKNGLESEIAALTQRYKTKIAELEEELEEQAEDDWKENLAHENTKKRRTMD